MIPEDIKKILMVDDDAAIRQVTEISLSNVGKWQVVIADSGQSALEVAAREKPDVILLDVMMPGMNGPTTFKLLQEQCARPNPPVIFMTAKVLRHEVDSYRQLGAAGVITKPFDPMTLPWQIKEILCAIPSNAVSSEIVS
jgi:CheY-like chemotaxis protein